MRIAPPAAGSDGARIGPLPIRCSPDPILRQRADPVAAITPSLRRLALAMVATMRAHPRCVGLAANQVGALWRVIVLDTRDHPRTTVTHGLRVIVNPVPVVTEGEAIGREGCLSLPGVTAAIARAARVVVRGIDLDGELVELSTAGFEAVVLQHEIDHLDGILILDRVRSQEDLFPRRR